MRERLIQRSDCPVSVGILCLFSVTDIKYPLLSTSFSLTCGAFRQQNTVTSGKLHVYCDQQLVIIILQIRLLNYCSTVNSNEKSVANLHLDWCIS